MTVKKTAPWLVAILGAIALQGCGGSGSTMVNAVFLDSPVEGLAYRNSRTSGTTDASGSLQCVEGETLTFSIGGLNLGTATCGQYITPLSLVPGASASDDAVVNRLMALQLLDDDNDPSNGIRITSAVRTALANAALSFTDGATNFHAALATAVTNAGFTGRTVDDSRRTLAREHFENSMGSIASAPLPESVTQSTGAGTVTASITRYQVSATDSAYIPYEGSNAATKAEFPKGFLPSFGSGLAFKGKRADGTLEFYGITDRGPNGDGPKVMTGVGTATLDGKYFPAPSFAPSIGVITVGAGGAVLSSTTPLRFSASQKASGLDIGSGKVGFASEVPLMEESRYLPAKADYSDYGLDTESVVVDAARGVLWVSDEYGPFILKVDPATGTILKKYQPGTGAADLPSVLAKRRANRGMEGLTLDTASGKLHGFLQSPLDDGKTSFTKPGASSATQESIKDYAKFARWVMFDPSTETTKLYAYPIDGSLYDAEKTGTAKLGDVVSLGNGKFIVIEQGARKSDGKVQNWLMLVELPANATDITSLDSELEKNSMNPSVTSAIAWSNVVTLRKTKLFDLNTAGWIAEKAEGLALVDDNTLALANDNDFGMKTKVLDGTGAVVTTSIDITKCVAKTDGTFDGTSGCASNYSTRPGLSGDADRPSRLWLIKFGKKLSEYTLP